jgi:hypothetical protein
MKMHPGQPGQTEQAEFGVKFDNPSCRVAA